MQRTKKQLRPGMVINIHPEETVRFEVGVMHGEPGVEFILEPGDTAVIHPNYSKRLPTPPGTEPRASIVENMTGGMVISVEDPRAAKAVKAAGIEIGGGGVEMVELPGAKRRKRKQAEAEESISDLDQVQE